MPAAFFATGWCRFPADPAIVAWLVHALPAARAAVRDPAHAQWLRCGGTWFAGVNALDNDATGAVAAGPPLAGAAVDFIRSGLGLDLPWDRGQVSVCYPGYPRPTDGESAAAFAYRRDRDAAHVDGLQAEGPGRRRFLREPHAFVLGIPLVESGPGAAPLSLWQGSHHIIRDALRQALAGCAPGAWPAIDLTEAYHAARRQAFARCRRIEISAAPGEAYLIHRLALHGMAPWADHATAGPDGRMIAYFRPNLPLLADWIVAP